MERAHGKDRQSPKADFDEPLDRASNLGGNVWAPGALAVDRISGKTENYDPKHDKHSIAWMMNCEMATIQAEVWDKYGSAVDAGDAQRWVQLTRTILPMLEEWGTYQIEQAMERGESQHRAVADVKQKLQRVRVDAFAFMETGAMPAYMEVGHLPD